MGTLCFDFDGTLCTNTGGAYDTAEPFRWSIARVNALAAAGHRILIFTARGTATGIDWSEVTRGQLARWDVCYDELHFGKPSADVYIDDRAVAVDAWRAGDAFARPGFAHVPEDQELPGVPPPPVTSVVEHTRTYAGATLRLEAHADRAHRLAVAAGLTDPPTPEAIAAAVRDAVERPRDGRRRRERGDLPRRRRPPGPRRTVVFRRAHRDGRPAAPPRGRRGAFAVAGRPGRGDARTRRARRRRAGP